MGVRRAIRRRTGTAHAAVTWRAALGLDDPEGPADLQITAEALRTLHRWLPWVGAAHLLAMASMTMAPGVGNRPFAILLLPALAILSLDAGLYALLRIGHAIAPPVVARVTAGCALGMGCAWAAFALLLPPSAPLAAAVAAGVSLMALALAVIPAALLLAVLPPVVSAMLASGTSLVGVIGVAGVLLGMMPLISAARASRNGATARIAATRAADRARNLLTEFEENRRGWFWETDTAGQLSYISPQLAQAIEVEPAAMIGRPIVELIRHEGDDAMPRGQRTLGFHLSTRLPFSDVQVRAAVSEDRFWSLSGRPATDEFGNFLGFRGSGTDLTERRRSELRITTLARSDGLTGLPNRSDIRQTLVAALAAGGRAKACAVFLLDLDRFKSVNDTLGHPIGDALLRQVADRLRLAAGDGGQVGRLGGDEFKLVLPDQSDRAHLAALARAIIERLSAPYTIEGHHVSIGASVGIAVAPDDGEDAEALIRNADLALYAAKADGKGTHRFYEPEMHATAKDRRLLEMDLRTVLHDGGLHLEYQPVVNAGDERIVGFEALIRWRHPTRGNVRPDLFIPIAEEIGLIPQIGEWVIRTACLEAARWPDHIRVAVNVSAIQFTNVALPGIVLSALAAAQLPANRLELEITEGVFLENVEATRAMFTRLKAIGVRFALDDFGTGYSSLGYLQEAPFDKIKIDQSFVRGAAIPGNRNAQIVRAIVALATSLDMDTTAEGAETLDELELIRSLGCSHIQGYVFGRPMPAEEVLERVKGSATLNPTGFLTSRSPRVAMLRSTTLVMPGRMHAARLRNISAGGAMVEADVALAEGTPVEIELPDGRRQGGVVRWSREGRIGIAFPHPIEQATVVTGRTPPPPRLARAG